MFPEPAFLHWAAEREQVRLRRAAGEPGPWTDDWIIYEHRFCNVSREDDRGTIEIKQLVRDPANAECDDLDLLKCLVLARMLNWGPTLQHLADRGVLIPGRYSSAEHWQAVREALHEREAGKHKVFGSAYVIVNPSSAPGMRKIDYVVNTVSGLTVVPDRSTRQAFHAGLQATRGFGPFMAGQVVADAAYTRLLVDAPDGRTWAPQGPGAERGMNRALGRHPHKPIGTVEYLGVGAAQLSALRGVLPAETWDRLTLHDVASNVNCETDKYLRIKLGQGKGRRYTGRSIS
jgi:hypothetical protein